MQFSTKVRDYLASIKQWLAGLAIIGILFMVWGVLTLHTSTDTYAAGADDFVTTWNTTNTGTSNNTSITISVNPGETYNYSVDRDNDEIPDETGLTGSVTHDFGATGTYTIRISGTFPAIYFNNSGDKEKIISVDQWGTDTWQTMEGAFWGATNLTIPASDAPDLSSVINMNQMFRNASSFNQSLNSWDTSNVTNMTQVFHDATSFNQPLSSWDTSNVTTMVNMFGYATSFNQDISSWVTSGVTTMYGMFYNATSFNQPLNSWDTSNVTIMNWMFSYATSFNQPLNNWDTSNVTNMHHMFNNTPFNQSLSGWDTSNVTDMGYMFQGANIFDQALSTWNTSNVTDMSWMFQNANAFNQSLSGWDVSKVTTMQSMFNNADVFNQPLDSWNLSGVSNTQDMFFQANDFNQDISSWDTTNITNMVSMFYNASNFNQSLGTWDISAAISIGSIFDGTALSTANYDATLIGWDAQSVQNGVTLGAGTTTYCAGSGARANLISNDSWTITDGGEDPSCGPSFDCSVVTTIPETQCDALVDIYDQMGGNGWSNLYLSGDATYSGWLTNNDPCSWYGVGCSGTGVVDLEFDGRVSGFICNYDLTDKAGLTSSFPSSFSQLNDLEELHLGGNTSFNHGSLDQVTQPLDTLCLNSTNLTGLDSLQNFDTSNLRRVRMDVNSISSLSPWAGKSIPKLLFFYINNNNLSSIDELGGWSINGMSYLNVPSNIISDVSVLEQINIATGTSTVNIRFDLNSYEGAIPANVIVDYTSGFDNRLHLASSNTICGQKPQWVQDAWDVNLSGNLTKTDIDDLDWFGGATVVNDCANGARCNSNTDCTSNSCVGNVCTNGALSIGDFVTTWNTANPGTSNGTSITIPTNPGETYNYSVDWDNDGTPDETGLTGSVTHDFGATGTYTVRISGTFPAIYFNNSGDEEKVLSVDQWGTGTWQTMESAFYGATNLAGQASDSPNLSSVTTMDYMFRNASSFNQTMNSWDVSNVTSTQLMFYNATSFNQPLDTWDVSNVTNMQLMFSFCSAFNQNINARDTSSVTTMSSMFSSALIFNQPLNSWVTSGVQYMNYMFYNADSFDQDISVRDTSNVTNMSYMFYSSPFNQDISAWDTSSVTTMKSMFYDADAFNQSLSSWDVNNVTNFDRMFAETSNFNNNINTWDVSSGVNMTAMFQNATSFNQDLSSRDVTNVTTMNNMLNSTAISSGNYDNILIGWDSQTVQTGVNLGALGLTYCNGSGARANLIASDSWTISDAGLDPGCGATADLSVTNITLYSVIDSNDLTNNLDILDVYDIIPTVYNNGTGIINFDTNLTYIVNYSGTSLGTGVCVSSSALSPGQSLDCDALAGGGFTGDLGTFTIEVTIDNDDIISETNEVNNTYNEQYTYTAGATCDNGASNYPTCNDNCAAADYRNGASCVSCTAGNYCVGGVQVGQTICPANNYCPAASSSPTVCPVGTFSLTGSTIIGDCSANGGTGALEDFDLDTVNNTVDLDDDNDGIDDTIEGTGDVDNDGYTNNFDLDSDGDGLLDADEGNIDTDGDLTPDFLDLDSDDDGLDDQQESSTPNGGDANFDGTSDGLQDEVRTLTTPDAGVTTTVDLATDTGCNIIQTIANRTEGSVGIDDNYDYPFGLNQIELTCSTAIVRIYYHGATGLGSYTYRKYDGASYTNFSVINGISNGVEYFEFTLVDGGAGDSDGTVNGIILDPGGPGGPTGGGGSGGGGIVSSVVDNIAWSKTYGVGASTKYAVIPASGGNNIKRDPAKRLALVRVLKQRKLGVSMGVFTNPSVFIEKEIEDLNDNAYVSKNTLFFLESMQEMMEGQSNKEQLMIMLNISKSLSHQSAISLQAKGLDRQQIAQVLYHVVLKYIVNALPGLDFTNEKENTNDKDKNTQDENEGESETEECKAYTRIEKGTYSTGGSTYVHVGCEYDEEGDSVCNAYDGDTPINEKLPILCIHKNEGEEPEGIPTTSPYHTWSAGTVALTDPIYGYTINSLEQANTYCEEQVGSGYIMAEHHDGRGWNFRAAGEIEENQKFWVSIDDQNSNPWDCEEE